jgi:hypothetical protein
MKRYLAPSDTPSQVRSTTNNWYQTPPPLGGRAEYYYLLLVQDVVSTVFIYMLGVTTLVSTTDPLCTDYIRKPFVEVLGFVHASAPNPACTAWLMWFDDCLNEVSLVTNMYYIACLYWRFVA